MLRNFGYIVNKNVYSLAASKNIFFFLLDSPAEEFCMFLSAVVTLFLVGRRAAEFLLLIATLEYDQNGTLKRPCLSPPRLLHPSFSPPCLSSN